MTCNLIMWQEYMYKNISTHWVQMKVSDPLEMELQVIVSHLIWALGAELRTFNPCPVPLTAGPSLHPTSIIKSSGKFFINFVSLYIFPKASIHVAIGVHGVLKI